MSRPVRSSDGFFHPASERQLIELVRAARREGAQLRVRGSAHSIAPAIYTDSLRSGSPTSYDVMLDRYGAVEIDEARMQVTVEAGCHLGRDPRDPTGMSIWDASLLAQLERRGWALPDLGGVAHQTVSGFLMTGSCGGTVRYSNEDAIVSFRFIDGLGEVHEVHRGDALFDAFGCSMGLLGVLSTITLQCIPRYDILGQEDITRDVEGPASLFERGSSGLEDFLRSTEYARLMWWPQDRVERLVTWQARRMRAEDYDERTGSPERFRPKPYDALAAGIEPPALARMVSLAAQWAGGTFYDAIAWSRAARASCVGLPGAETFARAVRFAFERWVLPAILAQFVPLDRRGPQRFWDTWWHGLPMDGQMSEAALPTTFTEIWVPLSDSAEVMSLLRRHFRANGLDATGTFLFEIYAARASRFWMHPGFARDSLRIDVFWFERNHDDPTTGFFRQFWELLAPFGYRLHWGKHLPRDPELGARHLRRHLPMAEEFLRLREELDPARIFLTSYWRDALAVAA